MGKHKKIINTAIAAFILVVGLFTKPLHVKAACLSHNGAGPMSSTEVIVGTCTIAGNTKEFFDWATSENDTVNRSDLQILPGASMTLAAGTTGLAVGKLTITGGSISIGSGASISVGAPIYVDDAYSTGTPDNSNHYSSAAAGRRRLAMMGNFLMEGDGHDGPLTLNPASLTTYNINTNVLTTVGSDLVSWWKMDNVSSNTTPDSWGTNTGTTSQSTTVQGRYFNALNFNGTSDYVTVPDAASLDPSNITLEAWVNPDVAGMDGQSTMIIDKARGAAATYDGYLLFYSDNGSYGINSLVLSVATPGSPSTRREWVDNAFPSKRWYHVAATYDGSDTKIYIDGVEKATTVTVNGTGNIDGNAYQLAIGKASTDGGYYFKGQIDDVRLYNSARTQQQIQADMNSCGSGSWRTTADGEAFPVSAIQSTSLPNTITLTGTGSDGTAASNASQTFTPGDEILLINQQGTIADGAPNVGNFEFLRVGNVAGAVLTVVGSIKRVYGATGDTNNSTLTGQKIVVQRVPNYTDVQIGSSAVLSAAAWNGTRGGIIAFRASGALTFYQNGGNGGIIDAVAVGYRGGTAGIAAGGGVTESSGGGGGESICGYNTGNGASSTTSPVPTGIPGSCGGGGGGARGPSDGGSGEQSAGGAAGTAGGGAGGGGGGGKYESQTGIAGGGGGGGYGTTGGCGSAYSGSCSTTANSAGGPAQNTDYTYGGGGGGGGGKYGDSKLSQLFMGSGGGGGGGGYGAPGSNGGPGSAGGAIVFIGCGSFTYVAGPNGTLIRSRSAYGTSYRNNSGCTTYQVGGGGGAGSGGSIKIMSRGSVYAGTNLVVATSGTVSTNCPTLCAGGGACSGGTGGMGRIAVFYAVSSSGTSNPTFCNLVTNANCP